MTKQSKSFGTTRAHKDHLVRSQGLAGEIRDLRSDVEEGFQNNEERSGFPHLDWTDVSSGAIKAAGGDVILYGRSLLQGQTFDTLTIGTGNAALTVTCLKPGDSGIRLAVVQGVGALAVTFVGGLLTVTLAAAPGGSTATAVASQINATTVGVIRAVAGGTGGSLVLVSAATPLAGGVGLYAGNSVLVSGVEALPKHAASPWTDTNITVTVPDLTALTPARAAGDVVTVQVSSDGIVTESLSGVLA